MGGNVIIQDQTQSGQSIPISSIICNNIKPLKATEQRIALDRINLFSRIRLGSSKPHMTYISAEL